MHLAVPKAPTSASYVALPKNHALGFRLRDHMARSTTKQIALLRLAIDQAISCWCSLAEDEAKARAVSACANLNYQELASLTTAYLALYGHSGRAVSPNTVAAYEQSIRRLLRDLPRLRETLLRPTRNFGPHWARLLEADGYEPATVRVYVCGARALYNALHWAGATARNPFAGLVSRKNLTKPVKYYTAKEIQQLTLASTLHDQVAIRLGSDAALRVSEAIALRWPDVHEQQGWLKVVRGKGSRERDVFLTADLADLLRRHRATNGTNERVLRVRTSPGMYYRLRQVANRAGVGWRGYHAFRHACGRAIYALTLDLGAVADHLGHSTIESTRIYAGRYPNLRALLQRGLYSPGAADFVPDLLQGGLFDHAG